jgi:hypothetical protein
MRLSQGKLRSKLLTKRYGLLFGGFDHHQNGLVGTGLNTGFALVASILVNVGYTVAHSNSPDRADIFTDAAASTFLAINVDHRLPPPF